MSAPIYTIAVLKAKEGRVDRLERTLEALAAATRQEAGCIEYFFVKDEHHDQQTIVSYEKWRSSEDEAAHWQTSHLKAAIGEMKAILDGAPIIHRGPRII